MQITRNGQRIGIGAAGGGGDGLSTAAVIGLIEARDDVIDGTPGNLPVAAAVQKLKLAPDSSGIVRTLVERVHHAVPRSGRFSVYTHAHYRGPYFYAPYPGQDTDDIFYYTATPIFCESPTAFAKQLPVAGDDNCGCARCGCSVARTCCNASSSSGADWHFR